MCPTVTDSTFAEYTPKAIHAQHLGIMREIEVLSKTFLFSLSMHELAHAFLQWLACNSIVLLIAMYFNATI